MRRKVWGIAWCCVLVALCASAGAQMFDPGGQTAPANLQGSSGLAWAMSNIPTLGSFDVAGINCKAGVGVGYRLLGLNINFGIPVQQLLAPFASQFLFFPDYGSLLDLYPLDVKISGAGLMVGSASLKASFSNSLDVFGTVQASLPKQIRMEAGEGPGIGSLTPERWSWTGSRFQWAQIDVGAGRAVAGNLSVIAGIKAERTTFRFADPEPIPGYSYNVLVSIFPPRSRRETQTFPDFGGDLNCRLLMPYLGARVRGPYYSGTVRAGLASASLKLPLGLTRAGRYIRDFALTLGRSDLTEEAQYKFSHTGFFLDGAVESKFGVTQNLDLHFCMEGSWVRVQGDGQVDLAGQSKASFLGVAFAPVNFKGSSSGSSHLSQYGLSAGVSGVWSF